MRFGFSPTQAGARFDAMCAQASLAEALGFDVIWAHEHHSGGSTYPSPLMTLAALAGVTKRIELGTNMLHKGPLKLKDWAFAIAKRSTMRKARIALARRLAIIMHAMLRHGTEFKPA